jgi:hypothetical protein
VEDIKRSKKKLNAMEASILMTHAFDSTYCKDNYDKKVIDIVGDILYKEELTVNGFDMLPEYLRQYNESGVLKFTGITFDAFLKLSPNVAETILKRCRYFAREESNAMFEANKEITNIREKK